MCIANSRASTKKGKKCITAAVLRKERKWNHTKFSVKKTKGRKQWKTTITTTKKKTRDQGQQIINSDKYNSY